LCAIQRFGKKMLDGHYLAVIMIPLCRQKGDVMDTQKKLTLRMPIELHARLEVWAKQERRSLHAQIIKVLENAVEEAERELGTSVPPRSE